MLTFWETIELLCEQRGVTPKVMAMRLRINMGTMYDWKNKGTFPRWKTLVKLSEYFHVPMDYFTDCRKNRPSEKLPDACKN